MHVWVAVDGLEFELDRLDRIYTQSLLILFCQVGLIGHVIVCAVAVASCLLDELNVLRGRHRWRNRST